MTSIRKLSVKDSPRYTLREMARWFGAIAIGCWLWCSWVVLWREASWEVMVGGLWLPLVILGATAAGRLRIPFPIRTWLRWDLWVAFLFLVGERIIRAVVSTGLSTITGRSRPGVVAVHLGIKSDMGRLLLLWAITVTPGTIALLLEGDLLYVHCLQRPAGPQVPGVEKLESLLKRIWD